MNLPRVLLVDDDPSVRRFVAAALEDVGVEFHPTSCIADAVTALKTAPFALVLTDLMLVGESGKELLHILRADRSLGQGPRVAVYSAGLSPLINAELMDLGAWRLLHKPVPLQELRRCVLEAVDTSDSASPLSQLHPSGGCDPDQMDVVGTYFDGNERLYRKVLAACEQQFPCDRAEGDRAFAERDQFAMRRLGHTLKSILQSLGHPQAAESAKALDAACIQGDWSNISHRWAALRVHLTALIDATAR